MGNVVKFEAHGKTYGLSVIDQDGQKWITSQQLGEAIGTKNIRSLIRDLREGGELKEGKHYRGITLQQPGDNQRRQTLMLSYRGVLRVAMRAQGSRSKPFRDWAEDVLLEVMLTGSYNAGSRISEERIENQIGELRREVFSKLATISSIMVNFDMDFVSKAAYYRRMGLSQYETGKLLDVSRGTVQNLEKRLKDAGILFETVLSGKRRKEVKDSFVNCLIPSPDYALVAGSGALQ
jgi:prophage antirepressor-like protein